jgi:hypothetical protein
MTKTFVVSGSDCRLYWQLWPVVWLVSTKRVFFNVFHIIFICLLPAVQVSMSFRQWSNIFLADQDERQRCFFADQKQFPADHWSLIGRYFEPWIVITNFNTNHWNRNITGTLPPVVKFKSQIVFPDVRNLIIKHLNYIYLSIFKPYTKWV